MSDVSRAAELFEAWRQRVELGPAEPFEDLVDTHPELRSELESLRRIELALDDFQPQLPSSLIHGTPSGSRPRRHGGLAPGDELGDFRIVRELGRGGMGIVFEAEQISLHRRVAVKILPAQLTLNPQALERFQREAEITGRLKHRGIVDIHQVGEQDGIHFIVMELVEGASLDRVIDRMRGESFDGVRKLRIADMIPADGPDDAPVARPRTPVPSGAERGSGKRKASSSASNKNYIESAVQLVCQVADALEHAHLAAVVHRDIKPANILVRRDGTPVLTDFGLARETGLPNITVTGAFAGTPNYVSPEQAMSGRVSVDHRSDIFSLGATLYELVTLHCAFEGDSLPEVLGHILTKPPVPPQRLNAALAPDLVTILEKSLEKDPDRRYQTAADFAADLRAFIEYRPIRARRTGTVVRTLRWAKREPLKAALGAVFVLGVPGATVLWTRAVEARREADDTRSRLELAELPDKLEDGFLELGTGELARAETIFADVLARRPDMHEAAAGLAMARLGQGRAAEALQALEQLEGGSGRALGRLRVEALLALGQKAAALELEGDLPPPRTASDKYLEGVRLLCGRPFLSGLPADSLLPLLRVKPATASARLDTGLDPLVAYRDRAREAIQLLEDAAADESRAIYHFALAWAAWVAHDQEIAERYGESIARKWPENRIGRFYAALAREVADPEGALDEYARLLDQDPGLWMARQRRAELFLARGRSDLAVAEARELVDSDPERLSFRIGLAQLLLLDGELEPAEEVARGVLDQDRAVADAHDVLGCVLYARGAVATARESFEHAVLLDPARALFQNHLGWTRYELGERGRALECFERARALAPEDPIAAYHVGLLHTGAEDEAALEALEEALRLLDANPGSRLPRDQVLGARGSVLHRLRRTDEASASLRAALALAPDDPTHLNNLGEVACALGRTAECIDARERWLQLVTGEEDDHQWLCDELLELGQFERALAAAKRWTTVFDACAAAWNERAWIQVDPNVVPAVGDPADALRSAERAVELSGGEEFAHVDTLACAQFASGLHDEALENALDSLRLARANGAATADIQEIEAHVSRFEGTR